MAQLSDISNVIADFDTKTIDFAIEVVSPGLQIIMFTSTFNLEIRLENFHH